MICIYVAVGQKAYGSVAEALVHLRDGRGLLADGDVDADARRGPSG